MPGASAHPTPSPDTLPNPPGATPVAQSPAETSAHLHSSPAQNNPEHSHIDSAPPPDASSQAPSPSTAALVPAFSSATPILCSPSRRFSPSHLSLLRPGRNKHRTRPLCPLAVPVSTVAKGDAWRYCGENRGIYTRGVFW